MVAGTLVAVLALGACDRRPVAPVPVAAHAGGPRLVVVLVADQMRADYLERFRPLFTGGLKRLLTEGVVFTDGHHFHAATKTAAGHATLASGRHPSHTGIIGNRWWDRGRGEEVGAVDDPEVEVSPARLLGTAFPDWLRQADPAAKVITASGKDRGAVLLGGRRPTAAFWFDEDEGEFVTSRYYLGKSPAWVEAFSRGHGPHDTFGELWTPLSVPASELAAMQIWPLEEGRWDGRFPHPIGGLSPAMDEDYYDRWEETPAADDLLEAFVEAAIDAEGLGADEHTDYLGVSFSVVDQVGHTYGPNSVEVLDAVLRLDRTLGRLFDFLDRRVPPAARLVAFSSDHGAAPLPELPQASGGKGVRAGRDQVRCLQQVSRELERRHGAGRYFAYGFYLDPASLKARRLEVEAVATEAAALVAACPGVARVFTHAELSRPATGDPLAELFAHSFHADRSADLEVHWQEFFLPDLQRGTTHGSAWPYDTHVPLIVVAPGIAARRIDERVHTVDLAPTLAALAGLPIPADVDGVDRSGALRAPLAVPASAPGTAGKP